VSRRRRWIVLGVIGIARFYAVVNADSAEDLILEPADLLAQPSPASTQRSDRPRWRRMAYAARQTPDVATQEIAA
jgi:hypothetical protein